jgi:hypothetical protein
VLTLVQVLDAGCALGSGGPTCFGLGARDPAVTGHLMACLSLRVEHLHRTVVAHLQLVEELVHGT